jgi:hypothetical protein
MGEVGEVLMGAGDMEPISQSTSEAQYRVEGRSAIYYDKSSPWVGCHRFVAYHRATLPGDDKPTVIKRSFALNNHRGEEAAEKALKEIEASPSAYTPILNDEKCLSLGVI